MSSTPMSGSSAVAVWTLAAARPHIHELLAKGCQWAPTPNSGCVLVVGPHRVLAEYRSVIGGQELTLGDVMKVREPTAEEAASEKVIDLREPL